MVVEVVTCPVCGSSAQGEGEPVYRRLWSHETNPPSSEVYKQDGNRCGDCGRLYTWDYGRVMDADTIEAMHSVKKGK